MDCFRKFTALDYNFSGSFIIFFTWRNVKREIIAGQSACLRRLANPTFGCFRYNNLVLNIGFYFHIDFTAIFAYLKFICCKGQSVLLLLVDDNSFARTTCRYGKRHISIVIAFIGCYSDLSIVISSFSI